MQTDASPINSGPPPPVYTPLPTSGEKAYEGQQYPQQQQYQAPNQQYPPSNQQYAQHPAPNQQYPYPAPNQQYPVQGDQCQQQTTTTVVVQQPVNVNMVFRETPVTMVCPSCHATITTGMTYEVGSCAWLACVGLCFIGCDFGCCLIPFCVDGCKDVHHHCPNCSRTVGRYNRL